MKISYIFLMFIFFNCFATVDLTINGTAYSYPETGDLEWGDEATNWASAVTSGALFKSGGTFTLTAETYFGPTYGLKSEYYKSNTSDVASSGEIRLAKTDTISFKDNAGTGNKSIGTSSDRLQWDSVNLVTISSSDTMTNKTLTAPVLNGALTGTGISTDSTLTGNSTTKVTTESAVKGYVDTVAASQDTLAELDDVQITAAALNDVLVYNGTKWADATTLAGLTLTSPVLNSPEINTAVTGSAVSTDSTLAADSATLLPTQSAVKGYVDTEDAKQDALSELTDVTITAPVNANSILAYNGSKWVNTAIVDANISTGAAIDQSKFKPLSTYRALVSNGDGIMTTSSATSTEVDYLQGVTSAIQTQINAKATNPLTTNGDIIYGVSSTPTRLAIGATSTYLSSTGSAPTWVTPAFLTDPTTTQGDLIVRGASAIGRLGIGSTSYILMSDGTTAAWKSAVNTSSIVVSSSTTGVRAVSAKIGNSGGNWSIVSQDGAWLSGINDGGTGLADLVVNAGIFSAAPHCSGLYAEGGDTAAVRLIYTRSDVTTTLIEVGVVSGAAMSDSPFTIVCVGAK